MSDRYAVIGNPVAHSKSPLIHAEFARQTGQDLVYGAILAPRDKFGETVEAFRAQGGRGMNVTVPFKFDAYRLCRKNLSVRASAAHAVNTLKFEGGDGIFGDNTDGAGLVADIKRNLGFALEDKHVLLMGAGGAAWGVALPLLLELPRRLVIANRTLPKGEALRRHAQEQFRQHQGTAEFAGLHKKATELAAQSYAGLDRETFDLVINATSSSLSGELPPLPEGLFAPGALAYDMMYGKEPSPFLAFAQRQGAAVADGLGMLVEQAAESFFIWRGVRPATAPVLAKLRAAFS